VDRRINSKLTDAQKVPNKTDTPHLRCKPKKEVGERRVIASFREFYGDHEGPPTRVSRYCPNWELNLPEGGRNCLPFARREPCPVGSAKKTGHGPNPGNGGISKEGGFVA